MKKSLAMVTVLSSLLFLLGMGEIGGSPPSDRIPLPEKNFSVLVVDREGIQTSLSQFSHEGKVFLAGKRGSASVAVPFDKIFEIQFQSKEGTETLAKVSLRDQKSIEVKLDKRSKVFGKAEFGTFQIEVKDLKSINFHP